MFEKDLKGKKGKYYNIILAQKKKRGGKEKDNRTQFLTTNFLHTSLLSGQHMIHQMIKEEKSKYTLTKIS